MFACSRSSRDTLCGRWQCPFRGPTPDLTCLRSFLILRVTAAGSAAAAAARFAACMIRPALDAVGLPGGRALHGLGDGLRGRVRRALNRWL